MAAGRSSAGPAKRGGVVVRHQGGLRFLPASIVARISSCPPISRVPGAPKAMLGIAYDEGEIVPVISLESDGLTGELLARRPLLVCRYLGEPVGIAGCEVVETGMFDADPSADGAVISRDGPARSLDLTATFASLRGSHWTVAEV